MHSGSWTGGKALGFQHSASSHSPNLPVSIRHWRLLSAAPAIISFLFNKLIPQNFVVWNDHLILILRVRSLVAGLGTVSLITRPRLVQFGWRVPSHSGFYSHDMVRLPLSLHPCPHFPHTPPTPPWYLTLQGLRVTWAFHSVVVSGWSTFHMAADFQLTGNKSCQANQEWCQTLAQCHFQHILLIRENLVSLLPMPSLKYVRNRLLLLIKEEGHTANECGSWEICHRWKIYNYLG